MRWLVSLNEDDWLQHDWLGGPKARPANRVGRAEGQTSQSCRSGRRPDQTRPANRVGRAEGPTSQSCCSQSSNVYNRLICIHI